MALPASKLELCNLALSELGVLSLEDADLVSSDFTSIKGQQARVCNRWYDISLDWMLEQFLFDKDTAILQPAPQFPAYRENFDVDKLAITAITQANPVVLSVVNTFPEDCHIAIASTGIEGLDGNVFAGTATGTTITLNDVNGTNFDAYTSGGTVAQEQPYGQTGYSDAYSYALPFYCLWPSHLESDMAFRLNGNVLVTHDPSPVLFYARKQIESGETALNNLNASFFMAFAVFFAMKMAPSFKESSNMAKWKAAKEQEFLQYFEAAKLSLQRKEVKRLKYGRNTASLGRRYEEC